MAIPAGYFYKDGAYWGVDDTGPWGWNGSSMVLLGGGGSGGYVYTGTWASKPASGSSGDKILATDVGPAPGTEFVWDGTDWMTLSDALWPVRVPFIMTSSGSIGNNGALSGIVALPAVYPAAYCYFPANAIQAGSAAGWYYTVFSSTTAGTIYQEAYTSGWPAPIDSPTAWVSTGPGAFTQVGTEVTAFTATLAAGALNRPGAQITADLKVNSTTAGTKNLRTKFGGATATNISITTSAARSLPLLRGVRGSGVQVFSSSGSSTTGLGSVTLPGTTDNLAVAQTFGFSLQIGTPATDWMVAENCTFYFNR